MDSLAHLCTKEAQQKVSYLNMLNGKVFCTCRSVTEILLQQRIIIGIHLFDVPSCKQLQINELTEVQITDSLLCIGRGGGSHLF